MKEIFSCAGRLGTLCEYFDGRAFFFVYTTEGKSHPLPLYSLAEKGHEEGEFYLGYTKEDIKRMSPAKADEWLSANA